MNWDAIIVAVIVAIPPLIVALRTHRAVNSRMDELLRISKENAAAKATMIERAAVAKREEEEGTG